MDVAMNNTLINRYGTALSSRSLSICSSIDLPAYLRGFSFKGDRFFPFLLICLSFIFHHNSQYTAINMPSLLVFCHGHRSRLALDCLEPSNFPLFRTNSNLDPLVPCPHFIVGFAPGMNSATVYEPETNSQAISII